MARGSASDAGVRADNVDRQRDPEITLTGAGLASRDRALRLRGPDRRDITFGVFPSAESSSGIPVIETERLRMRGHRLDDFAASAAMWSHPDVVRYIGGKPSTPQQSWMRLLNYAGHWALLKFGYWAIEEKATSAFAGEIGFADFKRDIDPSFWVVPEAGWVLAAEKHGQGFATEACRAIVAWSDRQHWEQTACIIDPHNAASIRTAEKCGYRELRQFEYNGAPTILFARKRAAPARQS